MFLCFTHPIFLTHPHSCFHLVLLHASSLNPFACADCRHLVLLHLKTLFRVLITSLGLSSQTHPMARHILSAIPSYRKAIPSVPISSWPFASSCKIIDPCFFFVFVSHSLILLRVCTVQVHFSLPKEKLTSKKKWSTCRRSTLDLPWVVLTLKTRKNSKKALFADCIHSSVASFVNLCPFMAHPKILNSASRRNLCLPDMVSVGRSHLSSGS